MTTLDPKYKHKPSEKHTLEEVLKSLQDLIRHDLVDEKSAASKLETPQSPNHREENSSVGNDRPQTAAKNSMHEDFAPKKPDSGPVNLDAVMRSLKDLVANELDVGDRPSPSSSEVISSSATTPSEPPMMEPDVATELMSLDETLTFDESPEIAPPSPAMETSDTLEFPGEISADILNEPETPAPTLETETPTQNIVTTLSPEQETTSASAEAQQKLLLDEAPVLLAEKLEPPMPSSETTSAFASEPIPPAEAFTAEPATEPEISFEETNVDQTAAENVASPPEDSLPTIEVDESFDENDYFNAVAEQGETSIAAQETAPVNPETAAVEPAPTEKKLALEIVNEPPAPASTHSIDFDSIASATPSPPAASISISETPTVKNEPPTITAEATEPPVAPPVLTVTEESPAAPQPIEIKTEAPTLEPPKTSPSDIPISAKPSAPKTKSSAADNQHSFNLDDIPVLQEVVAAPAGSTLAPKKTANTAKKQNSPDASRARDIVVRAVAKLNIEMRQSGGVGLDTKSILRLQQLIRAELEKDDKK